MMESAGTSEFVVLDGDTLASQSDDDEHSGSGSLGDYTKKEKLFLEKEGEQIHPIFNSMGKGVQESSGLLKQNSFNDSVESKAKHFLDALETYQASLKDSTAVTLDLRDKHSWEEVLKIAKDAETTYQEAGANGLRKVGRLITAESESMLPHLGLIPNGFYTSTLCGGLKLVFQAAAQLGERRDKVLKTLSRIPSVIAQAEHCVQTFPDQELYDRVVDVYVEALKTIEEITKWLKQHPIRKQMTAMMRGPRYTKSFKDRVQALNDTLGALQERVSNLRDGHIVRTGAGVERVQTLVDATYSKVENIQHMQHANFAVQQAREEAQQAMKMVLEEKNRTAEWMKESHRSILRLRKQVAMLQKADTAISQNDLLEILRVGPDLPGWDLQQITRIGQSIDLTASHRAIFDDETFTDWWTSYTSAALFIEGGFQTSPCGRTTPLSFMSSMVIEQQTGKGPAFPIHFFCGSHTSAKDPLRGPHGMMRSLISQIVRSFSVRLDFISSRRSRQQLESLNFDSLCNCFGNVLQQLPADTVLFCIIDGICFFESDEWAQDCRKGVEELQSLTKDDNLGPAFKLLITSPYRSRFVRRKFPTERRLLLLPDVTEGRAGLTEREISMAARRPARAKDRDFIQSLQAKRQIDSEADTSSEDLSESDVVSA